MYHATYARLNNYVSTSRLGELVGALEAQQCKVSFNLDDMQLTIRIPDERMWWVLTGCITVFFEDFKDVADWSFKFQATSPDALAA